MGHASDPRKVIGHRHPNTVGFAEVARQICVDEAAADFRGNSDLWAIVKGAGCLPCVADRCGKLAIGLGNLVAETEDEYVEKAVELASDVEALSSLRMTLRDLMAKSPLCDGPNFTLGLEQAYRKMWYRYCQGDVPSLRRMETLHFKQQQDQVVSHEAASAVVPLRIVTAQGSSPVECNGFDPSPLVPPASSPVFCDEKGAGGTNSSQCWQFKKGPLGHCNSSQMGVCLSDFVLESIEQDWCNQCLIFVIDNSFYDLVSLNVTSFPVSADTI
ncbi:hypothetical protein Cgig2_029021 [Carnegiea gigantea]|uniref:Uncharacterized protein n=1 Tax=Carnegiea gigantea TaxID=171969 RepID=A0A9Q1GYG8_9CARY|nr:hypothetical protein Cgig2_029021 [Carnegiea gigantea]